MGEDFDFIVVGGGSAGSVVAARLSEDPACTVLLLEAGARDASVLLRMPLAFRLLRTAMLFDWGFQSEPEAFANRRSIPAARGRVLGGSSSVNGMMYSRGHPRDYDLWAQMGARDWSFDDVLPFFRRSERNWRGESHWHGGDGPMGVSQMCSGDAITQAMFATARRQNMAVTDDFEGSSPEGFGLPDLTVSRGRRASASKAFLEPARRRTNLRVVTGAAVARILFDKKRAVGVEYRKDGAKHIARCAREIALCAGAYGSPHLLQMSGVGPADQLRRHGIAIVEDLSGVGANLQEHPLAPMGFAARKPFAFGAELRADRLARSVVSWALSGRGVAATQPLSGIAFHRSSSALERPDLETIFMPTALDANVWFPGVFKKKPDMMTALAVALQPRSRGRVELRSADPFDKPRIVFNLLEDPQDVAMLIANLRWTRSFMKEAPISEFVGDEKFPGAEVRSDVDLEVFVRNTVVTAQHPAGTCRMGTQVDCVVDPQLRVHAVEGLRIADASIMPALIGGHTNAPAIMIGERAAVWMRAS